MDGISEGMMLGLAEGNPDGLMLGFDVGASDGDKEGSPEGLVEEDSEGMLLGWVDGVSEGGTEGTSEGLKQTWQNGPLGDAISTGSAVEGHAVYVNMLVTTVPVGTWGAHVLHRLRLNDDL